MKKHKAIGICCLAIFLSVIAVYAQQGGFTGPSVFTGQQAGFAGHYGFTGQPMNVTVLQVVQTFPNKAPAVLKGSIVQHLGGDRYMFRDSSGDIVIKIKHDRWWGLTIGPSDNVEVGGNLKREKNGMLKYFDAKSLRKI